MKATNATRAALAFSPVALTTVDTFRSGTEPEGFGGYFSILGADQRKAKRSELGL